MATPPLVFAVFFAVMLAVSAAQLSSDAPQVRPVPAMENPHDLYKGNCTAAKDTVIIEFSVDRAANPGGYVRVVDSHFWPTPAVIDCVKLVDRIENGSGGYPFIVSGGVGQNNVEFGYVSQLSVGLKYITKIHYRP